jgi:hypothetical protein
MGKQEEHLPVAVDGGGGHIGDICYNLKSLYSLPKGGAKLIQLEEGSDGTEC